MENIKTFFDDGPNTDALRNLYEDTITTSVWDVKLGSECPLTLVIGKSAAMTPANI